MFNQSHNQSQATRMQNGGPKEHSNQTKMVSWYKSKDMHQGSPLVLLYYYYYYAITITILLLLLCYYYTQTECN